MTALELATAARVSCATLEDQVARGRHKKAIETARKLWERIHAMAAAIEDLTAEVERLQIPATIAVNIPDLPAPEFVTEIIEPPAPATVTLSTRPPGFDQVRARMRGHRPNPCALVEVEDPKPIVLKSRTPRQKIAVNRPGEMRGVAEHGHDEVVWKAVENAVLKGSLEQGRGYTPTEIKGVIGRNPTCMDSICLDLAGYRSPVKMRDLGDGRWCFSMRFAEDQV